MFDEIPEDISNYILGFLKKCEVCNKYTISKKEENTCVVCSRSWCKECNNNCKYLRWAYFEITLPICNHCYSVVRTSSFI